jgi:drug/metabolite transporter (DMT)-like permease
MILDCPGKNAQFPPDCFFLASMTRQRALVHLHIAAVLFGLTGVFGQLIQADSALITFGRAAFAFLALAGFALAARRPLLLNLTPRRLGMLVITGLFLSIHWILFFLSVKIGGIAIATLGFASFPAFITLIERIVFKARIKTNEWLVVGLVSAGLILVTPTFSIADSGTIGLAWGLGSGLAFALLAIANRQAAANIDPIQVAWWQNAVVAIVTLPLAAPLISALTIQDWLWMALLGVLCTALSHTLFVSSLTKLNARSAGIVIALEPVYAIGFAWMFFAQGPTTRMLLGAALILCGIVWSSLRRPGESHASDTVGLLS